jgi:SOS-response transcriptional repressor LexA
MLRVPPPDPTTATPPDLLCTDLSERQEAVWRAMRSFQEGHGGRPPSQRELSQALGMKSPQGCCVHFSRLAELGYIRLQSKGRWRAWIAVVPDGSQPVTPYIARSKSVPVKRPALPPVEGGTTGSPSLTSPTYPTVDGAPTREEGYTDRQIAVWLTMWHYQETHDGIPPTQAEVSTALGMRSIQGVRSHFAKLNHGGYIINKRRAWYAVRRITCEYSTSPENNTPTSGPSDE